MRHLSTVQLLKEWARWGQGHNIGYPSMSPMFGERALKSALYGIGHIPADVLQVEKAVCYLYPQERQILIFRYQRHLSFKEIGFEFGISRYVVGRRLKQAEDEVHHILSKKPCQSAPTTVNMCKDSFRVPDVKTSRTSLRLFAFKPSRKA